MGWEEARQKIIYDLKQKKEIYELQLKAQRDLDAYLADKYTKRYKSKDVDSSKIPERIEKVKNDLTQKKDEKYFTLKAKIERLKAEKNKYEKKTKSILAMVTDKNNVFLGLVTLFAEYEQYWNDQLGWHKKLLNRDDIVIKYGKNGRAKNSQKPINYEVIM